MDEGDVVCNGRVTTDSYECIRRREHVRCTARKNVNLCEIVTSCNQKVSRRGGGTENGIKQVLMDRIFEGVSSMARRSKLRWILQNVV